MNACRVRVPTRISLKPVECKSGQEVRLESSRRTTLPPTSSDDISDFTLLIPVPTTLPLAIPYTYKKMPQSSIQHANLNTITPPTDLTEADQLSLFEHFFRRLTVHRNQFQLYALAEAGYIQEDGGTSREREILKELDRWGQELLQNAWTSCHEPGGG